MSTHTPGPWVAHGREVFGFDHVLIATCQSARDAQAIAALPDLLDALLLYVMAVATYSLPPTQTAAWEVARAALAKAGA